MSLTQNGFSPWGWIQTITEVVDGIDFVTTSSHGGFHIRKDLWNKMPSFMRETKFSKGGWFEEDCDWCLPVIFFHQHFPKEDVELALKIAQGYHPDAYEFCVTQIPNQLNS